MCSGVLSQMTKYYGHSIFIWNKKHPETADTSASVTFRQGQESWCHYMPLIVLYLGTRYDVYWSNDLQDITICLLYLTFDLHQWPSDFVKVTCVFIIRCIICCWMFVQKMKFVGSIVFEIWTFIWRKRKWLHYDVITHLIFYEIRVHIC